MSERKSNITEQLSDGNSIPNAINQDERLIKRPSQLLILKNERAVTLSPKSGKKVVNQSAL